MAIFFCGQAFLRGKMACSDMELGVGSAYDWQRTAVHQGYMEYTDKSGQRVVKWRQEVERVWLVGRPFRKPHEQRHRAH